MGAELSRSGASSRVTAPGEREILADFLEALRSGAAAGAVEFLSEDDRRRASPELLAAMACAEIEHRAASTPTADGAEATIEFRAPLRSVPQWLEAFPRLAREPACVVEVIAADFAARRRCGAAADVRDYVEQFPQWAESISERLSQIDPLATVAVQPPEAPPRTEETQSLARSFDASTQALAGSGAGRRVRTANLAPDAEFGDYILQEEIARGGMGVVYKAVQRKLNRTVAVKMILSGNLASEQEVRRFYTEAEAAAHLDHPGIVPIYEVNEVDGQHFFSMGYVDGQSLQQRLGSGPLPPREAAEILCQTAEAIRYAHEHGVVHRDLKPSNILLTKDGRPRVTDFGLAKTVEGDCGLTASGQILGTPGYMPPEQAMGNTHEVGPHSDVYSLGALLYCLLTGRPPFQAATAVETLHQVIEREPARPRLLNPAVDLDLETICLKCLEKRKEHRIESAGELVAELTRYLAGEPIRSRRTGPVTRARRWIARNRTTAALVGLAPVLVVAIAASIVFAGRARESRELSQLRSAFQAGIERVELNPVYLREMEQLVTRIAARDPEEAANSESRLQSAWVAATDRAIRRRYLTDADVERIESALAVLEESDSDQAPRLRALLDQRRLEWQEAFDLKAPFAGLSEVFPPAVASVREGKLVPTPPPDPEDPAIEKPPALVVPTQVAAGPRVQLQAEFDAGWETGYEIGLTLNHGDNTGYDFVLRPAPVIERDLDALEDRFHERTTARRVTFAEARRRGRAAVDRDSPQRLASPEAGAADGGGPLRRPVAVGQARPRRPGPAGEPGRAD
jgi:predicted Ser/Thr protein kinase